MVNKNVAQKAVVAALSGMMALAPAAPAFATKIDLGWTPFQIRTLVKDAGGNWKRLAGDDRYETNVVANDYAYSEEIKLGDTKYYAYDVVDVAIVVSGENFADALAASGLSGAATNVSWDTGSFVYKKGKTWTNSDARINSRMYDNGNTSGNIVEALPAPIILTKKDKLSASAKDLLEDLSIEKVIVLGGTASVSDDVVNQIKDLGIDVDRVSGKDRAQTSVEALKYIANRYNALNGIVVCSGKTFADALSIAPVAIREGYGVVFTQPDGTLSQEAVDTIKAVKAAAWNSDKLLIVGGDQSVPDSVIGQLATAGMTFRRISGNNRYLTSVQIAKQFFGEWYDYDITVGKWDRIVDVDVWENIDAYNTQSDAYGIDYLFLDGAVVADGENYPDALTAGPIAALFDEPIVLVGGNSTAGIKFLKQSLGVYQAIPETLTKNNNLIVGGEASVSKATKDKLEDIDDFDINAYTWADLA